jgi:hypothetical protein
MGLLFSLKTQMIPADGNYTNRPEISGIGLIGIGEIAHTTLISLQNFLKDLLK